MPDSAGSQGFMSVNGLQGLITNVPGQAYGPLVQASTGLPLPYKVQGSVTTIQRPQGTTE